MKYSVTFNSDNIHGALVDTSSEVFGKARTKKKPWMTNDILDLCDRRRSLKNRRYEGPLAIKNYIKVNQAITRKMKQAKENWISDGFQHIDCGIITGNSKASFNALKLLTQR